MSKYTDQQLKDMATEFIDGLRTGDPRSEQVLQLITAITGIPNQQVIHKVADIRDRV